MFYIGISNKQNPKAYEIHFVLFKNIKSFLFLMNGYYFTHLIIPEDEYGIQKRLSLRDRILVDLIQYLIKMKINKMEFFIKHFEDIVTAPSYGFYPHTKVNPKSFWKGFIFNGTYSKSK